jgi:release factor glutamine methyltransferase
VTVGEVLRATAEYLEAKGVDSPLVDAEWLLAHTLGLSRLELHTQRACSLSRGDEATVRSLAERRGRREPLAYILGEWGFRRLTLRTDARALVPRPETEVVVERALALIASVDAPRVLDVGTGSGAIALAIKDERPDATVLATDNSAAAIALTRENATALELEIETRVTDLLHGITGRFDLVVSNPPYVLPAEELRPELTHEPRDALVDRGQTTAIADSARGILDGCLVLESHEERAGEHAVTLERLGYTDVAITRDLTGKDRVVEGRWTP